MARPDPAIVRVLREYKAALQRREQDQMAEMALRWLDVERALAAQMELLARDVADMRAAGHNITPDALREMQRYRDLLAQIRIEVARYTGYADQTIIGETGRWVQLSIDAAIESINAGYQDARMPVPNFTRLGTQAAENAIAWASKGAPLHELLAASYPDAVQGITQELINGTALGWNPVKTAAAMRNGSALGLNRSLLIARDQQMRAARAATDEQYRVSGVVKGKIRLAAKDLRTCPACLARDGEWLPLDDPGYDHPQGRCSFVPQLAGVPDPRWQTGAEWFETLDATTQERMLGNSLYQAWKSGKTSFANIAQTTEHDVWGAGLRIKKASEL